MLFARCVLPWLSPSCFQLQLYFQLLPSHWSRRYTLPYRHYHALCMLCQIMQVVLGSRGHRLVWNCTFHRQLLEIPASIFQELCRSFHPNHWRIRALRCGRIWRQLPLRFRSRHLENVSKAISEWVGFDVTCDHHNLSFTCCQHLLIDQYLWHIGQCWIWVVNRALIPKLPASPDEKFTKVQRQETVSLAMWHFSSIRAICILIINFMLASASFKDANHAGFGDEKCGVIRALDGLSQPGIFKY